MLNDSLIQFIDLSWPYVLNVNETNKTYHVSRIFTSRPWNILTAPDMHYVSDNYLWKVLKMPSLSSNIDLHLGAVWGSIPLFEMSGERNTLEELFFVFFNIYFRSI